MADMWGPMSGPALVPGGAGSFAPSPAAQFETAPPNGPDEIKEREGGWAKVQAFMQNPDMQMGLLKMGLMMMQPMPVGQTPAGHVANALGSSVDYMGAVQQQRLAQEQVAANTRRVQAGTENVQAQTRDVIPAQVTQMGAQTRATNAAANRSEQLLPKEIDQKVKELALMDWQLKDAPNESMRKDVQRRREELSLLLDEMYGSEDRDMKLRVQKSEIDYRAALAEGSRALTEKYRTETDRGKGWTIKNVTTDSETGTTNIVSGHADGRQRIVNIRPAMSPADAKAQATRDVKALTKEERAAQYPGLSDEQIVSERSRELQQRRTNVQDFDSSGVPGGGQAPQGRTAAPPIQPQQTQPVPSALADKPDGTIVPDDKGQWWVKRGKLMKPATEADRAAAQKKTKPEPAAVAPEGSTVSDSPAGLSQEVQQRYKTTAVRGSPSKFDYAAYDADMKELQDLVDRVESGNLNQGVAVGRIKVLSHKLGVPEPILTLRPKETPQPKSEPRAAAKPAKFSMNVRRGQDGKFAGFDVEEA